MPKYGPINPKFPVLWHGGDYNPDQWPEKTVAEDIRLANLAGVNVMSLGIFSWSQLEPAPGQYNWGWMDDVMDRLYEGGLRVALATPSAAHPRWLTDQHPEIQKVQADGRRTLHGGRQRFCPTSPVYREHVTRINRALAERYKDHPAVVLWHISNEYGGCQCYCDLCAAEFRKFLQNRYGDLDTLNKQWWTAFWSQRFTEWDQINAPIDLTATHCIQGLRLDWKRFVTQQVVDFFRNEIAAVRAVTPDIPVTHNIMGWYPGMDYEKFADVMDVISWDSYPDVGGDPADTARVHAYMRGIKNNNPWILMEQTPSSTNWKEYHTLQPPGHQNLMAWQAIGHGSDASMYFQYRRGRGAHEKFHGAVIAHVGNEDTRVFKEVSKLGADMAAVSEDVVGTRVAPAKVGILWCQENRWALEGSCGPGKDKRLMETAAKHYRAIWKQKIPIDVVRMDDDWSQYDLLIAPEMYMIKSGRFPKNGTPEQMKTRIDEAEKIAEFVKGGGTFVATFLTGLVNENDYAYQGYPGGALRETLGIWSEEIDNRPEGQFPNRVVLNDTLDLPQNEYACDIFFDQITAESAEVLGTYGDNWYAGKPCLTRNRYGDGEAWYVAADFEEAFLADLYKTICKQRSIAPLADGPEEVEVLQRQNDQRTLLFLLNHSAETQSVDLLGKSGSDLLTGDEIDGSAELDAYGVRIVKIK